MADPNHLDGVGSWVPDRTPAADVVELLPAGSGSLSPIAPLPPPPDLHPARVYLASLSEGSRHTMRAALENMAGLVSVGHADALALPWHELRYQHTAAIRSALAERYAPATANKMLSALRGVLKECWHLGYVSADDYHRARDLVPVRGETLPKGRSLSYKEIKNIFDACANDEKPARGARDAALYVCGLRRSEVAALRLSDCDPQSGELRVRSGKGNEARSVYTVGGAEDALADWISCRGAEERPLLCPVLKSGRVVVRRMNPQTVYDVLKRRETELETKEFSPHGFRRAFAVDLIDETGDLSAA
ncbi:MAG: site-specific integrase [Actinomycetota bacterium]|nr:site-specific integrase [Actinomycetota bacterium]